MKKIIFFPVKSFYSKEALGRTQRGLFLFLSIFNNKD